MFWPIFFFSASLIGLVVATYTDLKQRIVSNKLSYPLLAAGLAGHLALAAIESNLFYFAYSAIAALCAFAFAYLLWRLGVWAGGDVKLFTAIAALNPTNPYVFDIVGASLGSIGKPLYLPIFFISLFIFSVFAMLPYGTLIALHGFTKRKKERKEFLLELQIRVKQTIQGSAAVVSLSWILSYLNQPQLLLLPLLLLLGFLKNKIIRLGIIAALFAASLLSNFAESVANFAILFALFFGLYLLIRLYFLSKRILREKKSVSELEEGDIVAESLIEKNGIVQRMSELEIKRIINYLAANKLQELKEYLQPSGRVIASSRKAMGLTGEQISELKELVKERKMEDSIEVKYSAPFVPAMLIAYLALNIVGDALWILIL